MQTTLSVAKRSTPPADRNQTKKAAIGSDCCPHRIQSSINQVRCAGTGQSNRTFARNFHCRRCEDMTSVCARALSGETLAPQQGWTTFGEIVFPSLQFSRIWKCFPMIFVFPQLNCTRWFRYPCRAGRVEGLPSPRNLELWEADRGQR